ncbi:hypothetical protein FHW36_10687 [Chitinophaga polysaccharea]|uniref:Uncharacterized protein n=1 Tax=Chitinophaga polysaccharea TaxID=1293035 RepID=A0A561PL75_9BACT|nr:hypothetical protein [Chitinophaga polysaccharea]TWF38864.1 hypothetical protein FHW36_10687 [Chitinophaga polysaccharea]
MKNAYPKKPMLPYQRTQVEMSVVIQAIKKISFPLEVKRAGYMVFRKESGNGQSGINFNFFGLQADAGQWPDKYDNLIAGVVSKIENGTGKTRLFLAFNNLVDSLTMLLDRLQHRGLFVGGQVDMDKLDIHMPVPDINQFARAYKKCWAAGDKNAEPNTEDIKGFRSMYSQAKTIFL